MKITLSKSGIDNPLFHDYEYEYPESNRGANGDELTITISNVSGNSMSVIAFDKINAPPVLNSSQNIDEIKITLHGAIEHSAFFDMLKLIEEAHNVNSALGG